MRPLKSLAIFLPLALSACLPPATSQTPAPTIVGKFTLPPLTLTPPAIVVDGKPVITTCPVRVTIVATRYSSGSIFYEVTDLVPEKADGFAILTPRFETITDKADPPPADSKITRLHTAFRRTATENDLVQVHVNVEVEYAGADGRRHAPTLVATCIAELWGSQVQLIGEQKLLEDGVPHWAPPEERIESQKRVDVESDPSPPVQVQADPQWIPPDNEKNKDDPQLPPRRPVGHNTFVVRRGA